MKVDRRSFLSLGVGGAVGAALSPLPWKLMDDVSIWSQNWPWTPVPVDGEVSYINSTCTLCPGGCGITVCRVGGRPVKIEGMAGHPVNDGGICILGLAGLQLLYGPTRIQSPLKRVGKRGEGKWQPISWQSAMAQVSGCLKELRDKGESHTVVGIMERDRGTVPELFERFLTAYGSPNFFRTPSVQDSYEVVLHLMHGTQGMAGFDIENSDFIISFGAGLLEGWGSPVRMFKANSGRKASGARLIQIEPRLSNTAAKADMWIPLNPGTEAALALGLAHVVIREKRAGNFVSRYGFGFEDWKDAGGQSRKGFKQVVLSDYTPEKVSALTGIAKEKIEGLAKAFMEAKRPVVICGRGQGRTPGGIGELMAVHSLNALVGNINQAGGFWAIPEPDYIKWPNPEMDRVSSHGVQKGRVDGAGGPDSSHFRYLLNRLAHAVETGKPYPVNMLLLGEANPAYSLSDAKAVKGAFDKIPFVVSFSSYLDESAKNADLILPNHVFLERYEDIPTSAMFHKPIIGLVRPAVSPLFDTRHMGDVIIQLAKGFGGGIGAAFPWEDYETCLKSTLSGKWHGMDKIGFWSNPGYQPANLGGAFGTPSGKFDFVAAVLKTSEQKEGFSFPGYSPVPPEGDAAAYPLVMIPYDTMRLSGGYIGTPPFLMKTVSDTVLKGTEGFVEINPETAKKYHLREGDLVVLQTPKGQVRVRVTLYEGVRPGLIAMARGLGHTAYDEYLSNKGVNVNELMGATEDPISGLDAAWGIRAKLVKA